MRFRGTCYRAQDPKWSFDPVSGAGAAANGARFNAKGTPALYLALSLEGAIVEAAQGFGHKIEPLLICSYEVDCEPVMDLRTDALRRAAKIKFDQLGCAWKLDLAEGREPSSHRVARDLSAKGLAGMLVPSFATGAGVGMCDLILWRWGEGTTARVAVHDPSHRLPRDQGSWS